MIKDGKYNLVSGWKKKRYDPITKTFPSKFFNFVARRVSGLKLHDFNCGLKAYELEVVKNIEVYGEMHRYIPILVKQEGYLNIGEKVVQHQKRKHGVSKFGISRFINGFLDLLSLSFITRFSKKPMHFFGLLGTIFIFLGFLSALYIGFEKWYFLEKDIHSKLVTENPFFYIALAMMIIGVQLFLVGYIAELITRSSPDRNSYQIEKKIKFKNNEL